MAPWLAWIPQVLPRPPWGLENQAASPGWSDGPLQDLEENVRSYALEKNTTSTSKILKDQARFVSHGRMEKPHGATGESSRQVPASLATAPPPGAVREGAWGRAPGRPAPQAQTGPGALLAPRTPLPRPPKAGRTMPPSPQTEEADDQMADSSRHGPVRLETDFPGCVTSKKLLPPRTLGKRPDSDLPGGRDRG